MRCYKELKKLYGLQRGELGKLQRKEGINGFSEVNRSVDQFSNFMSQDEIAHEIGFSKIVEKKWVNLKEHKEKWKMPMAGILKMGVKWKMKQKIAIKPICGNCQHFFRENELSGICLKHNNNVVLWSFNSISCEDWKLAKRFKKRGQRKKFLLFEGKIITHAL